jgi:hypothetical protein
VLVVSATGVQIARVEIIRRCELEKVIETGLRSFFEAGRALAEIRDRRLYRDEHATFEDYCAKRWDLKRQRAYELIQAAEVVEVVSSMDDIPAPASERVARELRTLRSEPERMAEAWSEAVTVANGKPTARVVRDVVQQYREPEPKSAPVCRSCPTCGQRVRDDRPLIQKTIVVPGPPEPAGGDRPASAIFGWED